VIQFYLREHKDISHVNGDIETAKLTQTQLDTWTLTCGNETRAKGIGLPPAQISIQYKRSPSMREMMDDDGIDVIGHTAEEDRERGGRLGARKVP